ncbi:MULTISPECIES: hypothetical protein [unclassified Azospirillum]|uniref:hypothetical protein n=1 Tax=unclassified Azospirillum TaxID=2630922 RepID=UPI000B6B4142|nr:MULTISPECIES: hypothetical protein [unclassified Azospirillum]SNS55275.1 hypothetical protein SAMN05880556_10742 [Azospirillum sp. RU38E]SNS74867.1 hypothetical protein SAMN05880591_10742 [Azospirillum sp. RU37A]
MRIVTLSSEYNGKSTKTGDGFLDVDNIIDVLMCHAPDVVVAAGCSIKNQKHLKKLGDALQYLNWNGIIFVEVKDFYNQKSDFNHCLFAWVRDYGWRELGSQYFATMKDAESTFKGENDFEKNLKQRVVEFRGRRFGALICGEINALKGRANVIAQTEMVDNWFEELDVIVNPTHDRMRNDGTLNAKRSWISKNKKVYVSASNWNVLKNQHREAFGIHTIFHDCTKINFNLPEKNYEKMEVRIFDLDDTKISSSCDG